MRGAYIYQQIEKTTAQWAEDTNVYPASVWLFERLVNGKFNMKLSDGVHTFSELSGMFQNATVEALIDNDTTYVLRITTGAGVFDSPNLKGKSAYQSWLDAGNDGTEEEFVAAMFSGSTLAAEKAALANEAAGNANTAAENANEKAALANDKAALANEAAANANTAAGNANTAAENANEKAALADDKAALANEAAANANTAAGNANTAAENANEKAALANDKAALANEAAANANTAAGNANTAAENANEKAALANDKAALANEAAANANTAAGNANTAAENANEKAALADDKAALANEAAANANTAAGNANTAAENADAKATLANDMASLLSEYAVCGRFWDETLSSPLATGYYGNLNMLSRLPELLGLGCYLVQDDRTKRKLDPADHYHFADDGSPAALDGTMGQYMWCWDRAFYFSEWVTGNYRYYVISFYPIPGQKNYYIPKGGLSALGGGVMDRETNKLCSVISNDVKYRGGNNNAGRDGTHHTQLGMIASGISAANFSAYARARGEGWEANWYVAQAVVEILFLIIYGNRNMQAAVNASKDANGLYQGGLGNGVTTITNAEWNTLNGYFPFVPTNVGVELGDGSGEVSYDIPDAEGGVFKTVKVPVFLGLKHPFGYIWKFVRGLIDKVGAEKSEVYVAPSLYAGYNDASIANLIKVAECPRASGYIKKKSYYLLNAMPTEVGGSGATYFCDNFWESSASTQGLLIRLAGGRSNHGTEAGVFGTSSNFSASWLDAAVSSPLCFFEEDPVMSE
ncbi:MAG: hypothetical protein MdMp024_0931 [Bacteroidales bacterium]